MKLLLDLLYLSAAVLASPWIAYRLIASGEWKAFGSRFGIGLGAPPRGSIWLHGASVGEVSLLRPLVRLLERDFPDTPLVISSFTVTGLAAARKSYPAHRAILFPLDLSAVVARFLTVLDPKVVVIVESDYWPNFLRACRRRGVPVVVVNGKMSARAERRYQRLRLLPRLLAGVAAIAVQSREHAERFATLGFPRERLVVTGNMKYDLARPPELQGQRDALRRALGYRADDVVVIGGSLHEREDEVVLEAFRKLAPAAGRGGRPALILVPRYPDDAARVERNVRAGGGRPVRKSAVDRGDGRAPGGDGVLVVDTIGELGRLYAVADVAFVGGSLFYRGSNKGGHNLMEPAILGVPVLFGPYNFSFQETVAALREEGGGLLVRDAAELADALTGLVLEEPRRRAMGEHARRVVLARQGATERNCRLLSELLREDQRLPASAADSTMPPRAGDAKSR